MTSTIKEHPLFPFIEVGNVVDFAIRDGYVDHPGFLGNAAEWTFRIQGGSYASHICRSEDNAIIEAERTLFFDFPDLVDHHMRTALEKHNTELLKLISHRNGYWKGRQEERTIANTQLDKVTILIKQSRYKI